MIILASMVLMTGCDESSSPCSKNCRSAQNTQKAQTSPNAQQSNQNAQSSPNAQSNQNAQQGFPDAQSDSNAVNSSASGTCMADLGKHCTYNRDCDSMQCVNHVCRFESDATLGNSASASGSGSGSGSGSSPGGSSGSGSGSSAISGASSLWVAGGSTPSGSACSINQECESGLCYKGVCSDDCELVGCSDSNLVCRYGRCIPITTDGGECSFTEKKPFEKNYYNGKFKDRFVGAGINGCKDYEFCCNGFCTESACEPLISCQTSKDCASDICYG